MTSRDRARRHLLPLIVAAAVVLLTGCAGASGAGSGGAGTGGIPGEPAPEPTVLATPDDAFACGIGVSATDLVLGETLLIRRAPAPECLSLLPGSMHTVWLKPVGYPTEALFSRRVTITVADDGSFATSVTVPQAMPVGQATLRIEPQDTGYCPSTGNLDCILPVLSVEVRFDERDLRPVTIARTDVETPTLPDLDAHFQRPGMPPPYAARGPEEGQLTLVIWGSACATYPGSFVASAPADTLAILSETESDTCAQPLVPWTTVIQLPPERADPRTVTVDNVEAVLFDLAPPGLTDGLTGEPGAASIGGRGRLPDRRMPPVLHRKPRPA
ncbi:hypothetical protein ACFDTO_11725 [Microbacteriaceae bacterium 4G12]